MVFLFKILQKKYKNLIEVEFYELERFNSSSALLPKAHTYILWFNAIRKNSYKENKTPWEIIK
ncbi:MAG: hypothetical protein CBR30_06705 [Dictyoglomus sp. NZ13-RE01]|nr:MAG: hypothetical protein CBR30_06705 [Dictyoglomus sp. NZ13-RE01]